MREVLCTVFEREFKLLRAVGKLQCGKHPLSPELVVILSKAVNNKDEMKIYLI